MPLRHGKGTAPAWTAGCLGPFLLGVSVLGILIGFSRPMTFANILALARAGGRAASRGETPSATAPPIKPVAGTRAFAS